MRIDSFALTSNNVTYAAFGETMNYWGFFPTGDDGYGCIPVWGFADVVESRCRRRRRRRALLRLLADRRRGRAATGQREQRAASSTARRTGASCTRSTTSTRAAALTRLTGAAQEAEQALLRPLFITSFLIDDFLADNDFFGARHVILSSASSKTAYGTAFCLAQRRGGPDAVKVIGLTSPANLAFTRGLGCYDRVLAYDELATLPARPPAVYVDFSGSAALRASIHGHWSRPAALQLLGRRHALGRARRRQGPRRAASGAVLRAGPDQEAHGRLGSGRACSSASPTPGGRS